MKYSPQLRMFKPSLSDLPELDLPGGIRLRHFRNGDEENWERVWSLSFENPNSDGAFERIMKADPAFAPERVLFLERENRVIATASAWRSPKVMPETGFIHYVAVDPEQRGLRLGYQISLAALWRMRAEGLTRATLSTDDFRLPAVKTYLKLGFVPILVDENQRQRWKSLFTTLKLPELSETFAPILNGKIWQAPEIPGLE